MGDCCLVFGLALLCEMLIKYISKVDSIYYTFVSDL
jgi:hypothetical protein